MIKGQQLRAARERAGLTQRELAERVGVSPKSVGNWERGEFAPRSTSLVLEAVLADHLEHEPDAPGLRESSDAELLAEIARRFVRHKTE